MMPKRNIIVVGMPRSGTSLTASVYARKNYYVGTHETGDLRPADRYNRFGYWEAASLVDHNAEILRRSGFAFHNTWRYEAIQDSHLERLSNLTPRNEDIAFADSFNERAPWVWKDPRLCYTLGYWWPMVNPASTGVVLIRRHPEDIFQSFVRVGWRRNSSRDRKDVYQRIAHHMAAVTHITKHQNIPTIEIGYEEYCDAPDALADRMGKFSGIDLDCSDLNFLRTLDHSSAFGRFVTGLTNRFRALFPTSTGPNNEDSKI